MCEACERAVDSGLLVQAGRRGWGVPVLMTGAFDKIAYCPFCGESLPSSRVQVDQGLTRFVSTEHDRRGVEALSVAQSVLGRQMRVSGSPVLEFTEGPPGPRWVARRRRGPHFVRHVWAESQCASGIDIFAEVQVVGATITSLVLSRHDDIGGHLRGVVDAEWSVWSTRITWRWT